MRQHAMIACAALAASFGGYHRPAQRVVVTDEGDDVLRERASLPAILAAPPKIATAADGARIEAAQRRRAAKVARQAKGYQDPTS